MDHLDEKTQQQLIDQIKELQEELSEVRSELSMLRGAADTAIVADKNHKAEDRRRVV